MATRTSVTADLIHRLATSTGPNRAPLIEGMLKRWRAQFRTSADITRRYLHGAHFTTDLSELRLNGKIDVDCLLLGSGDETSIAAITLDFRKRALRPGHIPIVMALSEQAHVAAQTCLVNRDVLVLSPDQVCTVLEAQHSQQQLKRYLVEQIPRRELVPYNYLLPAQGGMFYGRENQLQRLRYDATTSFAIAGPGRIGKTSLIQEYRRRLIRDKHPYVPSTFYVDFYECPNSAPDVVARFLAMKIASSSRAYSVNAVGLEAFLRVEKSRYNRPLDLLLDEVDEVCDTATFQYLGQAAKQGLCRLVLCGRGNLFRAMKKADSQLGSRLELIRLEPLDRTAAAKLLLEPLSDLGYIVREPDRLVEHVLKWTGNLPHPIQMFGKQLVNVALDRGLDVITLEHVDGIKDHFSIANYYVDSLRDLPDARCRFTALALLRSGKYEFSVAEVQTILEAHGISLDQPDVHDICNDLVIHHVLIWQSGHFKIAIDSLAHYARALNYLDRGLDASRRELELATSNVTRLAGRVG